MIRARAGWVLRPSDGLHGPVSIRTVPLLLACRDGWLDIAQHRSESPLRTSRLVAGAPVSGDSSRKEITGTSFPTIDPGISTARHEEGSLRRMPSTGGTLRSAAEVPNHGV